MRNRCAFASIACRRGPTSPSFLQGYQILRFFGCISGLAIVRILDRCLSFSRCHTDSLLDFDHFPLWKVSITLTKLYTDIVLGSFPISSIFVCDFSLCASENLIFVISLSITLSIFLSHLLLCCMYLYLYFFVFFSSCKVLCLCLHPGAYQPLHCTYLCKYVSSRQNHLNFITILLTELNKDRT